MKTSPSDIISIIQKSVSQKKKKEYADKMNSSDSYSYGDEPLPYYAEMLNKASEEEDETMLLAALGEAVKAFRENIRNRKKWSKYHAEQEKKYQKDLKNGLPVRMRLLFDMPSRSNSLFESDIFTSIVSDPGPDKPSLLTFFGNQEVSIFDVDPKNVIKLELLPDPEKSQE